ncbi:putative Piezo non-specific cation channel; R-Ras-binding domain [Paratrimastix pyriformis]|uniref:Piezo non-specific cation channel n=1 Tax=Paratrimastix pyriformis TaxID=342808 RepID=A0ABQ8UKK0_9EUKA|nr:putative Piezo non-specific cation channel; R-Ras-binding domain [Paratrimastix pyriformis]
MAHIIYDKETHGWYWSATTNVTSPGEQDQNGVSVYVLSPTTPIGGLVSMGLVGVYVTVGPFLRMYVRGLSQIIIFTDMPSVDRLMALCMDIYLARQEPSERGLQIEETLYRRLIDIYRNPRLIVAYTRIEPGQTGPHDEDGARLAKYKADKAAKLEAKRRARLDKADKAAKLEPKWRARLRRGGGAPGSGGLGISPQQRSGSHLSPSLLAASPAAPGSTLLGSAAGSAAGSTPGMGIADRTPGRSGGSPPGIGQQGLSPAEMWRMAGGTVMRLGNTKNGIGQQGLSPAKMWRMAGGTVMRLGGPAPATTPPPLIDFDATVPTAPAVASVPPPPLHVREESVLNPNHILDGPAEELLRPRPAPQ